MRFEKLQYLEWRKLNYRPELHDLGASGIIPATPAELGFSLSEVPLHGADDYGLSELRAAIALRYHTEPRQVVISLGASGALALLAAVTIEPGDEVLVEHPSYESLRMLPTLFGARVRRLDRTFDHQYELELPVLERQLTRNTRLIILSNLHNPSSVALDPEKVKTIGQIAQQYGAWVILDEVYLEFTFGLGGKWDQPDMLYRSGSGLSEQIISINSLSKVYGLPGLRVGWAICPATLAERATRIQDYFTSLNPYPTQVVALRSLPRLEEIRARGQAQIRKNYERLCGWLDAHPEVTWVRPDGGATCMLKLPGRIRCLEFAQVAQQRCGTLVTPGGFFGSPGFLRIGLGGVLEDFRGGLDGLHQTLEIFKNRQAY